MRYQTNHKEKTRQRVLNEAAKALRQDGPHRLALNSVMQKAGLTHGGFYAHFASREALLECAIDEMFQQSSYAWMAQSEHAEPAKALKDFITFYLSPEHGEARTTGCPLPFLSGDMPRLPPVLQTHFSQGMARLKSHITRLLELSGHPDPDLTASSLLAEMTGAVTLARAETDRAAACLILRHSLSAILTRLGLTRLEMTGGEDETVPDSAPDTPAPTPTHTQKDL